jgi:hypothetical protein
VVAVLADLLLPMQQAMAALAAVLAEQAKVILQPVILLEVLQLLHIQVLAAMAAQTLVAVEAVEATAQRTQAVLADPALSSYHTHKDIKWHTL